MFSNLKSFVAPVVRYMGTAVKYDSEVGKTTSNNTYFDDTAKQLTETAANITVVIGAGAIVISFVGKLLFPGKKSETNPRDNRRGGRDNKFSDRRDRKKPHWKK